MCTKNFLYVTKNISHPLLSLNILLVKNFTNKKIIISQVLVYKNYQFFINYFSILSLLFYIYVSTIFFLRLKTF